MLLNYLKIAWKVLLRRKFFTFISLFGISFTLMILLVIYAIYDHTVGPHTPEKRVDRLVFIARMQLVNEAGTSQSNSSVGYAFLQHYVRTLRTPEKVSISQDGIDQVVSYPGNQSLKLDRRYTDAEFWQVLDFDFVVGRPYTPSEVRSAAHVAVINESTSRRYFGTVQSVVGRALEIDGIRYRVVGVVRDVPISRNRSYAELWVPVTTTNEDLRDPNFLGSYQAIVLAHRTTEVHAVQQEFAQVVSRVPVPDSKYGQYGDANIIHCYARTLLQSYTEQVTNEAGEDGGVGRFVWLVLGLTLLFMLLPALNLVNINMSRMLERSAEIGVRKAFGATVGTLIGQFLVENIFLTLLGGVLGLVLAAGVLYLINDSHYLPYANFSLNGRVFLAALGVVLIFGAMSGVYPAYKMSKLQAVKALKEEIAA